MAEEYVHIGFWINHSKGRVHGATLTIPPQDGALLVSFLALYVRLAGSQLWGLLCFAIHQMRSTREARDGLHHQQQVLLRNSATQNHTLLELLKIGWSWKKNAYRGFWRCLPLAFLAVTHTCAFALAGLFAYRATFSTEDEVLARSRFCGDLQYSSDWTEKDVNESYAIQSNRRWISTWSSNYARDCYAYDSPKDCNIFDTQKFDMLSEHTKCPFSDGTCLDDATGVVRLDSGPIPSDTGLGINSLRGDVITYRKAMTCAPLATKGFVSGLMAGDEDSLKGDKFYYYYFGETVYNSVVTENYTYAYDSYRGKTTDQAYKLSAILALLHDQRYGFVPVKALNTTDSDLVLIFMENFAQYTEPVTDLFFDAEEPFQGTTSGNNDPIYTQKQAVSVMGCTEQHQFCNPKLDASEGCTPLTGVNALLNSLSDLQFNDRQIEVAARIWRVISFYGLTAHIVDLGSSALRAKNSLLPNTWLESVPLSTDQWVQEVTGWHHAVINAVQRFIVQFASGTSNSANYLIPPSPELEWMCHTQKFRGTNFYNFKVLGLALILVPGGLIIIANQMAPSIIGLIQRITGKGLSRRREWDLTHDLQLQRMAYEGARIGTWESRESAVPVTLNGEVFRLPCDPATAPMYSPYRSYSPLPQQQLSSSQTYYSHTDKAQVRLSVTNIS